MSRPPAVARVLERVTKSAREHEMFLPGQTVLVACSGGPDSVCLLYSLYNLRRLLKIKLEVFHFDHRLRPDSAKDAAYTGRLGARLRLPFHLRFAETGPERGVSVEAWGRVARGNAANDVRREIGAERVAEGHTLDDQAETVLMALIVGSGLEGLAGIWPVLGSRVQPLIDVTRPQVEAFCRALRLRPRRDPTNLDTRFLRNALRLEAIPALERVTGRDVKETLARTADLLRADRLELLRQAARAKEELVEETAEGVLLPAAALLTLPRPIAARVVRLTAYQMESSARWTEEAVDAVLDLAIGRPGRKRDLPYGLKAVRDKEYVSISRPSPERRDSGGA